MSQFMTLTKPKPGDQVGIISPSAGLPGLFPWVQDLGLQRLRDEFRLTPKEYPTTRQMNAPLEERARDIMAAFSNPDNKAVFASIGGEDQIQLIKYLDKQVFLDNPKPFFGYSDNTHLHNFLWSLGIPSYYGGSIMTEFAFQQKIPEITAQFLYRALFEKGRFEIEAASEYNDIGLDWTQRENLEKIRQFEPNEGLYWDGSGNVQGRLWGGCVESLIAQCTTEKYLPKTNDLRGAILFIETAEDIPEAWIIKYLLIGFGERGWFDLFQGVLVGRPKAWALNKPQTPAQKKSYKQEQRETISQTIRMYNKTIPIVQNLDFGHTAPQIVMPYGGLTQIDTQSQKVFIEY